jgi:hypothetical protein
MKNKETLQQLFQRTVGENLLNVVFGKPDEKMLNRPIQPLNSLTPVAPEEQLLKVQNSFRIKVQSVALPVKHQLFTLKSEAQVLDWLQNKIHNVHSAYYQFNNKYKECDQQVSWYNNKMQNQKYLKSSGK